MLEQKAADEIDGDVIDLRDPSVADGLAEALSSVIELSERAGIAETRADFAMQERLAAVGKARQLGKDLEAERAERSRLETDFSRLSTELAVQAEELRTARLELARTCDEQAEVLAARDNRIGQLSQELATSERAIHTLEALIGRRRRRVYRQIVAETSDQNEAD